MKDQKKPETTRKVVCYTIEYSVTADDNADVSSMLAFLRERGEATVKNVAIRRVPVP